MKKEHTHKAVTGAGFLAAAAASLCCITPLLAVVAGAGGAAASASWLEPARPFFLALTVVFLAFAWYRSFRSKGSTCVTGSTCAREGRGFFASRSFLLLATVVTLALAAFPWYSQAFYPKSEKAALPAKNEYAQTTTFTLSGMTCAACEGHVDSELAKVTGVLDVQTSYAKGTTVVHYDRRKVTPELVRNAIAKTGYEIIKTQ